MATQLMSALPALKIPGYTLIRELGRGGMAVVYLAIQESFGRDVALKVLTPDRIALDESFTERFIREAKIVSSLVHPNIVTVYDVGMYEGQHYLSMEYVPGTDLKDAQSKMSRRELLRVIKDVALALDYAGNKGYVHGDVKPENIMIHESDGRVILMDFGIAHGLDSSTDMARLGKAIGTPYYMSPEQSKGKPVDHRSDIYSLGVVLYQMLTGFVPYDAESAVAVCIKHIDEPIPLLPKRLEMFQPIINTAMSKNPQHRFQTAAAFVQALYKIDLDELDRIEAEASEFKMVGKDYEASTLEVEALPELVSVDTDIMHDLPRIKPSVVTQSTVMSESSHAPSYLRRSLLFYLLLIVLGGAGYLKKEELFGLWQEYEPRLIAFSTGQQSGTQTAGKNDTSGSESAAGLVEETALITVSNGVVDHPSVDITEQYAETDIATTPFENKVQTPNDRILELLAELDSQPEHAIELAELYKAVLRENPQDVDARQGMGNLRQWYMQGIHAAEQSHDSKKMRQLLTMLESSFPKVSESRHFQELEASLDKLETVEAHLLQAEQYFKTKAWVQPVGANAFEEWRAVIALDKGNQQALDGINKIASELYSQALEYQKTGKYHSALTVIKQGFIVSANNQTLLTLEKKLNANITKQQRLHAILLQADTAFKSGYLISPEKQNAYDFYQSAIKLDKTNRKASNGLKQIEKQLILYADDAINKSELDKAAMTLEAVKQRYKNSELLERAETRLQITLEEVKPKVTNIQFSATELSSLSGHQNKKLLLGRTLYIGFRYKNFEAETTLLQAVLFDGTGRVQITQKPIIVNGETGVHFFDIELPVEGFAEGSYKLELVLGTESLIAESFLVDHRGAKFNIWIF